MSASADLYNQQVPTFFVTNFGCRATQADGAAIERQLLGQGLHPAEDYRDASVVVLNTCTVTESADRDVRASIRRIHRENPECKIMVTGCYAQRAPEEIAVLAGVTWVVGNSHKHEAAGVAAASFTGAASTAASANFFPASLLATPPRILVGDMFDGQPLFAHTEVLAAPVFDGVGSADARTRPNLKIQDGCDNRCSFCIIPFVRGANRSLASEQVLRELDALAAAGYREVVLSGINLGRWGRDFDSSAPVRDFESLLRFILERSAIERIRISSVEPMDWSDDLIRLVAGSPRIARHAHLPLQSGSDAVLRMMHRKYRPWHYAEKVHKIRKAMPSAAIGADVMTGFPGESDELFEQSRSFIDSLPFTYLHVFTYSSRPGTPSAAMPQQVPVQVARERNRILRELAAAKNLAFRRSQLGGALSAITLARGTESGSTEALTDNYLKVDVAGRHAANQWLRVNIEGLTGEGLQGSAA